LWFFPRFLTQLLGTRAGGPGWSWRGLRVAGGGSARWPDFFHWKLAIFHVFLSTNGDFTSKNMIFSCKNCDSCIETMIYEG